MIHILKERANRQQVAEMLETLDFYVKFAVDIKRGVIAGGGILHADCKAALLKDGSQQDDIWGADWIPTTQGIKYEAFINIRPRQDNPSMTILSSNIRKRVEEIIRRILGGV